MLVKKDILLWTFVGRNLVCLSSIIYIYIFTFNSTLPSVVLPRMFYSMHPSIIQ